MGEQTDIYLTVVTREGAHRPMVVLHNANNLLIFESIGLAKNHRYEYPYESSTVCRTGGEIPDRLH